MPLPKDQFSFFTSISVMLSDDLETVILWYANTDERLINNPASCLRPYRYRLMFQTFSAFREIFASMVAARSPLTENP
jgi:hypothetical protein